MKRHCAFAIEGYSTEVCEGRSGLDVCVNGIISRRNRRRVEVQRESEALFLENGSELGLHGRGREEDTEEKCLLCLLKKACQGLL